MAAPALRVAAQAPWLACAGKPGRRARAGRMRRASTGDHRTRRLFALGGVKSGTKAECRRLDQ